MKWPGIQVELQYEFTATNGPHGIAAEVKTFQGIFTAYNIMGSNIDACFSQAAEGKVQGSHCCIAT